MKALHAVLFVGLGMLVSTSARGAAPQGPGQGGGQATSSSREQGTGRGQGTNAGAVSGAPAGSAETGLNPIRFNASSGWPIVPSNVPRPSFLAPPKAPPVRPLPSAAPAGNAATPPPAAPLGESGAGRASSAIASGMDFGSPLLDIYQSVRAPGAFRALGGRTLRWKLTVHGPQGESIGSREVTHVLDCSSPTRDRLEYEDGKVFGRSGKVTFASRQGLPWPTLQDLAEQELERFSLHARAPWCFGNAREYAVLKRERVTRDGRSCSLVVIERIPDDAADDIGPSPTVAPRDTFEVVYDVATGEPLELSHCYGKGRQKRRMRLEDWRELDGVRVPYRRTYVDEAGRPTLTLDLLHALPTTVSERMFRL
ncbi:MAG: hypothetical protein RL398_932 [Planctomycetota bacterium]|jgi:hypothetical protein